VPPPGPYPHSWFQSRGQGRRQAPRMSNKGSLSKGLGWSSYLRVLSAEPRRGPTSAGFCFGPCGDPAVPSSSSWSPKMMWCGGRSQDVEGIRGGAARSLWKTAPIWGSRVGYRDDDKSGGCQKCIDPAPADGGPSWRMSEGAPKAPAVAPRGLFRVRRPISSPWAESAVAAGLLVEFAQW
jgi:hypothetical protein